MIFRRRTTRIELERTTINAQTVPSKHPPGTHCPTCGAPIPPSGTHPQHEIQPLIQESSK